MLIRYSKLCRVSTVKGNSQALLVLNYMYHRLERLQGCYSTQWYNRNAWFRLIIEQLCFFQLFKVSSISSHHSIARNLACICILLYFILLIKVAFHTTADSMTLSTWCKMAAFSYYGIRSHRTIVVRYEKWPHI